VRDVAAVVVCQVCKRSDVCTKSSRCDQGTCLYSRQIARRLTMATDGPATTCSATASTPSTSPTTGVAVDGTTKKAALRALVERTGFPIVQENGQRKYGPPPDWPADRPPPARGCEVFVGKIPRDCFEV